MTPVQPPGRLGLSLLHPPGRILTPRTACMPRAAATNAEQQCHIWGLAPSLTLSLCLCRVLQLGSSAGSHGTHLLRAGGSPGRRAEAPRQRVQRRALGVSGSGPLPRTPAGTDPPL